jgi:hypothetical protein
MEAAKAQNWAVEPKEKMVEVAAVIAVVNSS